MIRVRLRHRFPALSLDLGFEAPTPGATVLFGPSGAGKSTLIHALAGLFRPDEGLIEIDGETLLDTERGLSVPPERRRIGVVFQDARLFPHLAVEANLRYGLKRAPPGPIAFDPVIDLLGIRPLLARRPHTLSGGERQRVAIGRALLAQPRLLLMDEPLASLDTPRKAEILPFLLRLKAQLALPILYVTHAFEEMQAIADTVVLLRAGRTLATGPIEALTARSDLPLAQRDDAGAVLAATLTAHLPDRGLSCIDASGMALLVPQIAAPPGARLRLRIPAREIILATEPPRGISLHNIVEGHVRAISPGTTPHLAMVEITAAGATLLAGITQDAVARLSLAPGTPVLALIKAVAVEVRLTG